MATTWRRRIMNCYIDNVIIILRPLTNKKLHPSMSLRMKFCRIIYFLFDTGKMLHELNAFVGPRIVNFVQAHLAAEIIDGFVLMRGHPRFDIL